MEEDEVQEGGITLGDIFRTIFSQKWLALIIAVVITVIGTVGLYLMGKNSEEYVSTFTLRLPGSGENPVSYYYPDGTVFHYTDLMSKDTLDAVKNSDKEFSDIDVEKMVEDGGVSVVREMVPIAEGANEYSAKYTLSIESHYFKKEETARKFIVALTEVPGAYLSQMKVDYDVYLTASASAATYDTQLAYLQSQLSYVSGLYSSFIGSYQGSFVIDKESGKTLNYYKSQIDVFAANNRIGQLKNEALEKGYIKDENSLSEYKSELFEVERQLEIENKVYEELVSLLKATQTTTIFDNPQIIEQQRTIRNLERRRDDLNNYISSQTVDAQFKNSVAELEAQIRQFTVDVAAVADAVYKSASTVNFMEANVMTVEGGRSIIMCAVISLVIGIVVAAIIAYIVGWYKRRKALTAKTAAAPVSVQTEAEAQVAVTDAEENNEDKKDE